MVKMSDVAAGKGGVDALVVDGREDVVCSTVLSLKVELSYWKFE